MNDTITIVGTIGTDPERKVRGGVAITTFRVASKERRFDKASGTWIDGDTNWYTASAYRRLADHAFASLHRRERVVLTGRLKVRNWETGDKRGTSVDIDIDAIGHDLLFGTTVFRSDEGGATATAADEWSAPDADDGWEVPGRTDASHASAGEVTAGDAAGEDAGALHSEPVGAQTPF